MANESHACNCMGPQNGEPFCPCMMNRLGIIKRNGRWIEPEKDIGPVIDPTKPQRPFTSPSRQCTDFRHNPPMHLYVAPGETYVHECPSCGAIRTIVGNNITFEADVEEFPPDRFMNIPSFNEEEDEDAFAAESDQEILDKLGR